LLSNQTKKNSIGSQKRCLIQLIRPKGEKIKNKRDDQVSNVEKIQINDPKTIIKPYPNLNATKWMGSHSEMGFSSKKKKMAI
jgi:hypothetical protein